MPPRQTIPLAKAREILKALEIEEPDEIDPAAIAFQYDAAVQEEPLDGMDGNIVRDGNKAVITVNSRIAYPGQKRFVIAHELGHFFLHPHARQVDTVDAQQTSDWSETQEVEEYEANLFAAELLMPQAIFAPKTKGVEPSFALIEKLCTEFNTTFTSTAVQFVLNTDEECVLISSANRQRAWFIRSRNFSFQLLSDPYIHGHSCAKEVGPNRKTSRSKQIEAGFWFEGFRHDHKAYITEDARYFSQLGKTLSLLWVHDVI